MRRSLNCLLPLSLRIGWVYIIEDRSFVSAIPKSKYVHSCYRVMCVRGRRMPMNNVVLWSQFVHNGSLSTIHALQLVFPPLHRCSCCSSCIANHSKPIIPNPFIHWFACHSIQNKPKYYNKKQKTAWEVKQCHSNRSFNLKWSIKLSRWKVDMEMSKNKIV